MTFLAGLSGCSGSTDVEFDGGNDRKPDAEASDAPIDAKPDHRAVTDAAHDATRDGTNVTDAPVDASTDHTVVADAASDAGRDGDAASDAGSEGSAVMDAAVDAALDGALVGDAADDVGNDVTIVGDAGSDAATQAEAGAQDASVQDGAPSEAGTPTDAAEDGPEASTCTLGAVAATPFPPLSGSADVTGTVDTATGAVTMPDGLHQCIASVTTPTSGVLFFAFTSTGCSFSYQDASGGTVFTSTIGDAAPSFDGDTYTCTFSGMFDPNDATFGTACPELLVEPGVNAVVSFAVSRSTGAVTVSRQCVNNGVAQFCGGYPDSTGGVQSNVLAVSGSILSCAGGGGGQILCGTTSCAVDSQVCCLGTVANPAPFCTGTVEDCFIAGGLQGAIGCSGPESCLAGEVCCPAAGGPDLPSYQCQLETTCASPNAVACESNLDCPVGEMCSTGEPGTCGP